MKNSKIYLSPPHLSGKELHYIREALDSNWVAPVGPNVTAFENEIAAYTGANGAAVVSSGTAAIHLALSLLEVKKENRVFCSTLTFVASANPILYQGAEPVFIDSEPETWNMSPQALERALKQAALERKLPKAVILVNLYGQSAKMEEIISICNQYDVPIVEDAAESLGTTYKGKASGTFGKFGIYSFNGNKIITTSGGGALVSDDKEAIEKARFLSSQAKDAAPHYQHSQLGYNYRMSNLLAGVGRSQLQVLQERVTARRQVFNRYYRELAGFSAVQFMPELRNTVMNRWLTTLTIKEEKSDISSAHILHELLKENIEARPVWKPLHLQPLFRGSSYYPHQKNEHVAEKLFETGICLPSGSNLQADDQERIIDCLKRIFNRTIYKERVQ